MFLKGSLEKNISYMKSPLMRLYRFHGISSREKETKTKKSTYFNTTSNFKRMQIIGEPYSVIDWDNVPIEKHSGENGFVWSRTFEKGNIRR